MKYFGARRSALTYDPAGTRLIPHIDRLKAEEMWEVNVPIVQPIYDLWHFLDEKYTVSVYRVSSENPNSLPRDPLLDVV